MRSICNQCALPLEGSPYIIIITPDKLRIFSCSCECAQKTWDDLGEIITKEELQEHFPDVRLDKLVFEVVSIETFLNSLTG